MSSRKTTVFYGLLIAVASLAVGMVLASRLDLSPLSMAQPTITGAGDQQRAAERAGRRGHVPEHRQGRQPVGRQHPHRVAAAARRSSPSSSAAAATTCSSASSADSRARQGQAQRPAASSDRANRSPSPPAPASSSARTASSSPTTTSSKAPPRSKSISTATTRTSAIRPGSIGRDPLTDSALIELTEKPNARACGSQVRRLGADGARRLGDGHRQSVQPGAHRQRRRGQRGAAGRPAGRRRTLRRRDSDRRRDQSRQLGRPAPQRARRSHRHQHGDLRRLASAGQHGHRLRHSRSTSCATCCRSCAAARSRAASSA